MADNVKVIQCYNIDHTLNPSKSPHYKNTLSGALVERDRGHPYNGIPTNGVHRLYDRS